MLRQRIMTAVAVLGLGVSLGVGALMTPSEAHAEGTAVERCHELRRLLGEETFNDVYGNFGGCVGNFSITPDSAAAAAHGCHFLVSRGFYDTIGECVNAFKTVGR